MHIRATFKKFCIPKSPPHNSEPALTPSKSQVTTGAKQDFLQGNVRFHSKLHPWTDTAVKITQMTWHILRAYFNRSLL